MKYLIFFLFIISLSINAQTLKASDPCFKDPRSFDCRGNISKKLFFDENDKVSYFDSIIKKHGVDILYDSGSKVGLSREILNERHATELFDKYIIPNFDKFNTNDNLYLDNLLLKKEFTRYSTVNFLDRSMQKAEKILNSKEIANSLWDKKSFPNSIEKRYLELIKQIENYPKDRDNKSVAEDLKMANNVLLKLKPYTDLSKNLCQIHTISEYETKKQGFGNFYKNINNDLDDILLCALKNNDTDLASHLIELKEYNPEKINEYLSFLELGDNPFGGKFSSQLLSNPENKNYVNNDYVKVYEKFQSVKNIMDSCISIDLSDVQKENGTLNQALDAMYFRTVKDILKSSNGSLLGDKNLLDKLLKGYRDGIDVNYIEPDTGKTIAHYLAEYGDKDLVRYMEGKIFKHNTFDYTIKDKEGNTPAHIAARAGNYSSLIAVVDMRKSYMILSKEGKISWGHVAVTSDDEIIHIKDFEGNDPFEIIKMQKRKEKIEKQEYKILSEYYKAVKGKKTRSSNK